MIMILILEISFFFSLIPFLISFSLNSQKLGFKFSLKFSNLYSKSLPILGSSSALKLSSTSKKNEVEKDIVDESVETMTFEEEISSIIDDFINVARNSTNLSSTLFNPMVLSEKSHIITKGRIYESVINKKLELCSNSNETALIEHVNNFMTGYIQSERKRRSRMKVNYILASVYSNKFEDSINLLSESDEIDEYLLNYIESLIQKELLRAGGPTATLDEDKIDGVAKVTIDTLKMIDKRLKAEIKTKDRDDIKLLAKLIQESDPKVREMILLNNIKYVEDVNNFLLFVEDGLDYIKSNQSDVFNNNNDNNLNIYQKLKFVIEDVKLIKKLLETGTTTTDTLFSTSSEDYLS